MSLTLTPKAINNIADGIKPIQGNYCVQLLNYSSLSPSDSIWNATISDGTKSMHVLFINTAGVELKSKAVPQFSIISILDFFKEDTNDGKKKIYVGLFQVLQTGHKNVIGNPVDYFEGISHFSNLDPNANVKENPVANALIGFSVSGIAGLCAAYFVKKIARAVAFTAGGFFLVLQFMAYKKMITIHWSNWVPSFTLAQFAKMITYNSLGFGAGFYWGVKKEIHRVFEEK